MVSFCFLYYLIWLLFFYFIKIFFILLLLSCEAPCCQDGCVIQSPPTLHCSFCKGYCHEICFDSVWTKSMSCLYKYHCYPHVLHSNELPDNDILAKAVAEHEAKRNNISSTDTTYNNNYSSAVAAVAANNEEQDEEQEQGLEKEDKEPVKVSKYGEFLLRCFLLFYFCLILISFCLSLFHFILFVRLLPR